MFDIAIVGAGIVGSLVARELARLQLDVHVFEHESDVAMGASKANSGIVHAGYDARPDSLKAYYNVLGCARFDTLAHELDFPFRRNGSLVLAFGEMDLQRLEELHERGRQNGVKDMEIVNAPQLRKIEPNITIHAAAALHITGSGIVSPYEMTIAAAENAAANGVVFHLSCGVEHVEKDGTAFILHTAKGQYRARVLINAAGINAGRINNLLSKNKITLTSRKGEYCLFDSRAAGLVGHTLFPLPDEKGKGILLTPTADGNILAGPTSVDTDGRGDTESTADGMRRVLDAASRYVDNFPRDAVITAFAGVRARNPDNDDFIIEQCPDVPGLINIAGIDSPGLTASPAIAEKVGEMVHNLLSPKPKASFNPIRKAAPRFRHLSDEERAERIAENPDYGCIVCRCEHVSKAEILEALNSPLAINDLDAVKRRTRVGMGRCQSGFCGMRLPAIISEKIGIPITAVQKMGEGSIVLPKRK